MQYVLVICVCTVSRLSRQYGYKRQAPEVPTQKAAREESTCEGGVGPRVFLLEFNLMFLLHH